jgi:hypothetical protein
MGGESAWGAAERGEFSLAQIFFGSRPSIESGLGLTLAALVIVAVLAFLVFLTYVVLVKF